MAEGTGLGLEEIVLLTLHEELWHKGVIPASDHCTTLVAGPPDTKDGRTYAGQTWDWPASMSGLSSVLHWKRSEGPGVLAYSYPGLWIGAGLNAKGVALCWNSGSGPGAEIRGPRVGVPSYVIIAQMLYQETLKAAIEEARRARNAGWFVFSLGDGTGQLATVWGSPKEVETETGRGHLSSGLFEKNKDWAGGQQRRMLDLLGGSKGKLAQEDLKVFLGDHASTICKHPGTVDALLFSCTDRKAYVTRGPACSAGWKTFTFDDK
jgi:isopenicillin-N N-acyltransferase-like protein